MVAEVCILIIFTLVYNTVMFHTTDPTPSPSPLETLHRCIVDHHTVPVVCSLCPSGQWPESSGTLLYVKTPLPYLWHFTCQWTPLNTCILTQHLGLQSHTEQILLRLLSSFLFSLFNIYLPVTLAMTITHSHLHVSTFLTS